MDKKRILVVDDEEDVLKTVSFRLESFGYEVITAKDGMEGLEKARNGSPDLIVLDLMLPKIDGYKVCVLLKNDKRYSRIPIVMFTAKAGDADKKMGLDLGADAYIMKPFEPEELLKTIDVLLGEKK